VSTTQRLSMKDAAPARQGQDARTNGEDAGDLLRSIESNTVTGLRDRVPDCVMVFIFARISA
jgi:hypothetical protein